MISRISGARLAVAVVTLAGAAAILYGCAGAPASDASASLEARTVAMMKDSFEAHGRLERGREDRAGGARHAVLRRPEEARRGELLCVPPVVAAGALLRHDGPVALPVREEARLHRGDAALRVGKDLRRRGRSEEHTS